MPRTGDYSLRFATKEDVIPLAILGKQFTKESKNSKLFGWNMQKVYDSLFNIIDRDDFCVICLVNDAEVVGMLIALVTPCFFSDVSQAVEIAWYIDPDHRGTRVALKMINEYERWAKEAGAVCTNMINLEVLNGDKVARMYNKRGYTLVENTFLKEL